MKLWIFLLPVLLIFFGQILMPREVVAQDQGIFEKLTQPDRNVLTPDFNFENIKESQEEVTPNEELSPISESTPSPEPSPIQELTPTEEPSPTPEPLPKITPEPSPTIKEKENLSPTPKEEKKTVNEEREDGGTAGLVKDKPNEPPKIIEEVKKESNAPVKKENKKGGKTVNIPIGLFEEKIVAEYYRDERLPEGVSRNLMGASLVMMIAGGFMLKPEILRPVGQAIRSLGNTEVVKYINRMLL